MYLSYKTITPVELGNGLSALIKGVIDYRAFRVYLGAFELIAIREVAERVRTRERRGRGRGPTPHFQLAEIAKLSQLSSEGQAKKSIRELEAAGLLKYEGSKITINKTALSFSDNFITLLSKRSLTRPIPVPRPLIRFLAACPKRSIAITMAAYLLRGLSINRSTGEVKACGTVKATWIASTLGLSLRAVKAARAELVRAEWINRDTSSYQRKLNRDGSYFVINLAWRAGEMMRMTKAKSAPPPREKCLEFAPPKERHKTPYGSKNQETLSGVSKKGLSSSPTLVDILPEDLESFSRTETLYHQAVERGLIPKSENAFLNWVGAAVRAKRVEGNSAKVFMGIVKKGLFHHLTHEDEERARKAIGRYRQQQVQVKTPDATAAKAPNVCHIGAILSRMIQQLPQH